jgi:hypothetical protein
VHVLSAKTRGCCRDRDPHPHPSDRSKSDCPVRPFARQKGTRAISHKVTCKCSRACILCPSKIIIPYHSTRTTYLSHRRMHHRRRVRRSSSFGRDTSVDFWGERIFDAAVSSGWSSAGEGKRGFDVFVRRPSRHRDLSFLDLRTSPRDFANVWSR